MTEATEQRRPHWGRRVLLALLAVALVAGVALAMAVWHRLEQRRLGEGVVQQPSQFEALEGSSGRTGSFTARIDFTSMATGSETISTEVLWDDDWFFRDPTEYNHDLATTCSVLSAVANSESAYYQAGSDSPAYMEAALAALGFEEISTASYQYRSEIFDEVVDFITGTDDVVAYSVATKRLSGEDGAQKTLFLVSVRGSYGSEWLSDLNMGDAASYQMDEITHEGFSRAARARSLTSLPSASQRRPGSTARTTSACSSPGTPAARQRPTSPPPMPTRCRRVCGSWRRSRASTATPLPRPRSRPSTQPMTRSTTTSSTS